jgi:hypothetical protein
MIGVFLVVADGFIGFEGGGANLNAAGRLEVDGEVPPLIQRLNTTTQSGMRAGCGGWLGGHCSGGPCGLGCGG